MKKIILNSVMALPFLLLFTGCPVGIDYTLGYPGKEEIDKALIGTWTTVAEDPDYRTVTISKKDNFSYDVEVFETGSIYSLDVTKFTAWVTKVGGKTFLYAQPVGSSDEQYYLYCYEEVDKKTMKSFDVSLLDGGMDSVSSTETYRAQVETSLKIEECLTEEKTWTKE
ncbi:MAG: hypothetical protein SH857_00895 [Chitinophagales bacterium]|nr:hypothetical protein [Chitinophagales bacterium]